IEKVQGIYIALYGIDIAVGLGDGAFGDLIRAFEVGPIIVHRLQSATGNKSRSRVSVKDNNVRAGSGASSRYYLRVDLVLGHVDIFNRDTVMRRLKLIFISL